LTRKKTFKQHEDDVATIKRLNSSGAGKDDKKGLQMSEKAISIRESEMQKKHRQEMQEMEGKIAKLKARIEAKSAAPSSAAGCRDFYLKCFVKSHLFARFRQEHDCLAERTSGSFAIEQRNAATRQQDAAGRS
jgi:anti-sigma28 factor (negative regulator of flagellin synthesis)